MIKWYMHNPESVIDNMKYNLLWDLVDKNRSSNLDQKTRLSDSKNI